MVNDYSDWFVGSKQNPNFKHPCNDYIAALEFIADGICVYDDLYIFTEENEENRKKRKKKNNNNLKQ